VGRNPSKRALLEELLRERNYSVIDEAAWAELLRDAGVSESYLKKILREAGTPMSVLVDGVRQSTLDELERTLIAIEREYDAGGRERKKACRRQVIQARDHARFALRSPKASAEKKVLKEEMVLWMQTWLENPGAFLQWVAIRKRVHPIAEDL
jgi:hypothetical protein